eukprot:TRINITY_DN2313_c1_g1_i1.p1 TRINITY_DN2313_c1_g1~~TRINITY_DN2313_c1_g1_i1.p1  ORF type:complete len:164 (+),score=37.57 TRINITY_DN2313_c1_g1_i1:62-553(+)
MVSRKAAPNRCAVCKSNKWCNQRVSKMLMSLRCFNCKANRKLNKNLVWYHWKCDEFHRRSECELGDKCPHMHIFYSKLQAKNCASDVESSSSVGSESESAASSPRNKLPRKTTVSRMESEVESSPDNVEDEIVELQSDNEQPEEDEEKDELPEDICTLMIAFN